MSWTTLRPHPGFVLIDEDGSARAYINTRPGPGHNRRLEGAVPRTFPMHRRGAGRVLPQQPRGIMTTLRLPTITVDIGESQPPPLPSVAHDIAIVGYYSGNDSLNAVVSPAVGTLSASLHTRAAVQDFIGDTSPAYYAAAAILSHVAPTSIHVLSLGDPAAPVPADEFATHLERLANTSDVHLPTSS